MNASVFIISTVLFYLGASTSPYPEYDPKCAITIVANGVRIEVNSQLMKKAAEAMKDGQALICVPAGVSGLFIGSHDVDEGKK